MALAKSQSVQTGREVEWHATRRCDEIGTQFVKECVTIEIMTHSPNPYCDFYGLIGRRYINHLGINHLGGLS
jgi:hypothetical protein